MVCRPTTGRGPCKRRSGLALTGNLTAPSQLIFNTKAALRAVSAEETVAPLVLAALVFRMIPVLIVVAVVVVAPVAALVPVVAVVVVIAIVLVVVAVLVVALVVLVVASVVPPV